MSAPVPGVNELIIGGFEHLHLVSSKPLPGTFWGVDRRDLMQFHCMLVVVKTAFSPASLCQLATMQGLKGGVAQGFLRGRWGWETLHLIINRKPHRLSKQTTSSTKHGCTRREEGSRVIHCISHHITQINNTETSNSLSCCPLFKWLIHMLHSSSFKQRLTLLFRAERLFFKGFSTK